MDSGSASSLIRLSVSYTQKADRLRGISEVGVALC